jgi:heme exporter protein D
MGQATALVWSATMVTLHRLHRALRWMVMADCGALRSNARRRRRATSYWVLYQLVLPLEASLVRLAR